MRSAFSLNISLSNWHPYCFSTVFSDYLYWILRYTILNSSNIIFSIRGTPNSFGSLPTFGQVPYSVSPFDLLHRDFKTSVYLCDILPLFWYFYCRIIFTQSIQDQRFLDLTLFRLYIYIHLHFKDSHSGSIFRSFLKNLTLKRLYF